MSETAWKPAGAHRAHPIDAPEQCFDAEKHGSPYFFLMVRADIGDRRGIEVSCHQGTAVGNPGYRTILPVQRLTGTRVGALQSDPLEALLRSFRWQIEKYTDKVNRAADAQASPPEYRVPGRAYKPTRWANEE